MTSASSPSAPPSAPGQPTSASPSAGRGIRSYIALAAVVLLPLAFAGLVVAAVSQADEGLDLIPAAIVDNDEMVTVTEADGTQQQTLVGRLLVTNLTGPDSPGFDWTITNSDDAQQMLASGEVYAVVEVPSNFTASVLSLSSATPVQADITIRTDDSHDYLVGSLAQLVGDSMVATFGEPITEQYISGLYSSIGQLGEALSNAAGGATSLSDGATSLAGGATETADGAVTLADGASTVAGGVGEYTAGVSDLAGGIDQYVAGVGQVAAGLEGARPQPPQLDAAALGLGQYTDSVAGLAAEIRAFANDYPVPDATPPGSTEPDPNAADPANGPGSSAPVTGPDLAEARALYERVQAIAARADAVAAARTELLAGVNARVGVVTAALGEQTAAVSASLNQLVASGNELSSGADALAASGPALVTGSDGVAAGANGLAGGTTELAAGAGQLAGGADQLAAGLTSGAAQVPVISDDQATASADVAASPVGVTVDRENEVSDIGQILATFFVPLGLWVGALAVFLLIAPVTRSVLASTATQGRIAASSIARASALTGLQAVLLVLLLHLFLGVRWSVFPATFLFALLVAVSFTAFHYLLTVAFRRMGPMISLFLLALQITVTGSLYPIEILTPFFRTLSPFLPLTHAVAGFHSIISGGALGTLVAAWLYLIAFGLLSALGSLLALRRLRASRFAALIPASP